MDKRDTFWLRQALAWKESMAFWSRNPNPENLRNARSQWRSCLMLQRWADQRALTR